MHKCVDGGELVPSWVEEQLCSVVRVPHSSLLLRNGMYDLVDIFDEKNLEKWRVQKLAIQRQIVSLIVFQFDSAYLDLKLKI